MSLLDEEKQIIEDTEKNLQDWKDRRRFYEMFSNAVFSKSLSKVVDSISQNEGNLIKTYYNIGK